MIIVKTFSCKSESERINAIKNLFRFVCLSDSQVECTDVQIGIGKFFMNIFGRKFFCDSQKRFITGFCKNRIFILFICLSKRKGKEHFFKWGIWRKLSSHFPKQV